jgi:hypothetical protein
MSLLTSALVALTMPVISSDPLLWQHVVRSSRNSSCAARMHGVTGMNVTAVHAVQQLSLNCDPLRPRCTAVALFLPPSAPPSAYSSDVVSDLSGSDAAPLCGAHYPAQSQTTSRATAYPLLPAPEGDAAAAIKASVLYLRTTRHSTCAGRVSASALCQRGRSTLARQQTA